MKTFSYFSLQNYLISACTRRHHHQRVNFEQFLTEYNLQKCVEKLSSMEGLKKWKKLKKNASVLIPLCHVNHEVCILYTLRTTILRKHSGQVSFPGGMRDNDETAEETAVRETEEEIGISRDNIKVYGCGAPVGRQEVLITPVVGYVGLVTPVNLNINDKEVQYAFALPLLKFCDLRNCRYTKYRNSYTLPVFLIDGYRVWGVTAYMTHIFLKCLLGETYKFTLNNIYEKV